MNSIHLLIKIFILSTVNILLWSAIRFNDYMPSAENVYEEYFSEYHLSASAKKEVMTELKLIMNYFSYKKAQGADADELMRIGDQLAAKNMTLDSVQVQLHQLNSFASSNAKSLTTDMSGHHRPCKNFLNFLRHQEDLVVAYQLPYSVENSALQMIDINDALILKGEDHMREDTATSPETVKTQKNSVLLKSFAWHDADIVVGHRQNIKKMNAIQGYYNHMGIYNAACGCIIDAIPYLQQNKGVRQSSWEYWAENFTEIAILRIKDLNQTARKEIASYALVKMNEPYAVTAYKKNELGGWYCSKLVYMAYLHAGIDLDRKHGISIFPDDIAMHPGLETHRCLFLE